MANMEELEFTDYDGKRYKLSLDNRRDGDFNWITPSKPLGIYTTVEEVVNARRAAVVQGLESAIIQAATDLKLFSKGNTPAHAYTHAYNDLMSAVDALLKFRDSR